MFGAMSNRLGFQLPWQGAAQQGAQWQGQAQGVGPQGKPQWQGGLQGGREGRFRHHHGGFGRDRWQGGQGNRAQLTPQQRVDAMFKRFDTNGDGTITKAELLAALQAQQAQQPTPPAQAPTQLLPLQNSSPTASAPATLDPSLVAPGVDPTQTLLDPTQPLTDPNSTADANNSAATLSSDPTSAATDTTSDGSVQDSSASNSATAPSPADPAQAAATASVDPATLQQQVLQQLDAFKQSANYTQLSQADQQSFDQLEQSVQALDPTAPDFQTQLQSLLGG